MACDDPEYGKIIPESRMAIEDGVIVKATINSIDRVAGTATVTYDLECSGHTMPTTDVGFYYFCEPSDNSADDHSAGHRAFRRNDRVYVMQLQTGPEDYGTFIIGHLNIRGTKLCNTEYVEVRGHNGADWSYVILVDIAASAYVDIEDVSINPEGPTPPTEWPTAYNDDYIYWRDEYFSGVVTTIDVPFTSPATPEDINIDGSVWGTTYNYWPGDVDTYRTDCRSGCPDDDCTGQLVRITTDSGSETTNKIWITRGSGFGMQLLSDSEYKELVNYGELVFRCDGTDLYITDFDISVFEGASTTTITWNAEGLFGVIYDEVIGEYIDIFNLDASSTTIYEVDGYCPPDAKANYNAICTVEQTETQYVKVSIDLKLSGERILFEETTGYRLSVSTDQYTIDDKDSYTFEGLTIEDPPTKSNLVDITMLANAYTKYDDAFAIGEYGFYYLYYMKIPYSYEPDMSQTYTWWEQWIGDDTPTGVTGTMYYTRQGGLPGEGVFTALPPHQQYVGYTYSPDKRIVFDEGFYEDRTVNAAAASCTWYSAVPNINLTEDISIKSLFEYRDDNISKTLADAAMEVLSAGSNTIFLYVYQLIGV